VVVYEVGSQCVNLVFIVLTKHGHKYENKQCPPYSELNFGFWILNVNIQFGLSWVLQSVYQNSKIYIKYNDNVQNHFNRQVRQGCGLSSDLLNLYRNKLINQWKQFTQNSNQLWYGSKIWSQSNIDAQKLQVAQGSYCRTNIKIK
jgi:hypothetical protein